MNLYPKEYLDFYLMINQGVDLQNRTVYLSGPVEDSFIDTCVNSVDYFNSPKHCPNYQDPITLIINSPGGYVDYMLCLYDKLVTSEAPIHTVGIGQVASAATILLACGDKRSAYENLSYMVHKISLDLSGHDDEVIAGAEATKKLSSKYWYLMERHSNFSAAKWLSLVKKKGEVWLNAQDLLRMGIVDEIIKPTRRELKPLPTRNLTV